MRNRSQSHKGENARIRSVRKANSRGPRTASEYFSKSQRFQDTWNRVVHVVSKMRVEKVSLRHASQEFGITPRTVIRWGGTALRKRSNGQYAARASDRLLRVLVILTSEGLREIAVLDSRQASLLGEYWSAVQKYIESGDSSALSKYRGKFIRDAEGKRIPLLTNVEELDRLGSAGVISFESLYAKAA